MRSPTWRWQVRLLARPTHSVPKSKLVLCLSPATGEGRWDHPPCPLADGCLLLTFYVAAVHAVVQAGPASTCPKMYNAFVATCRR